MGDPWITTGLFMGNSWLVHGYPCVLQDVGILDPRGPPEWDPTQATAGFEAVAITAWGESVAGQRALIRACILAWSQQLRKFEDMDRDLSNSQDQGDSVYCV